MFERVIRFSIEQRWLVLLAVLGMAALGIFSYQKLPIDAVPDITNVQVQINTAAPGYSPLEAEQRVTYPIETVMAGLPGLQQTRSLSRYGLSQVTVIFEDGTDIYFARQLVNERIQSARESMPGGISPVIGPISTGLGEIYLWTVEADEGAKKADGTPYTPTDLREIQDWIIKPQLRNVKGVTEINSIGGYAKEFQVAPDPAKLLAHGLTMTELVTALERNNANVGAGYIEKRGEQYLIRAPGQVKSAEDIGNVILGNANGIPLRVRDVAEVGIGQELRTGAATDNGREVVLGTVFMLIGENSRTVSQAVDKKMQEINRTLARGREGRDGVRPHRAGRQGHCHGEEEPLRRRGAGHCGAVSLSRQHPRGAHHGAGHSAVDAVHLHRHGEPEGQRQPHEPGRAGLRHHHRRGGGDRGELRAAPRACAGKARAAAHAQRALP